MDDLNAENKRLAKKVRDVLRADQDRMETHKNRPPSNMTDTERAEWKMRQTQLSSQSKVSAIQSFQSELMKVLGIDCNSAEGRYLNAVYLGSGSTTRGRSTTRTRYRTGSGGRSRC